MNTTSMSPPFSTTRGVRRLVAGNRRTVVAALVMGLAIGPVGAVSAQETEVSITEAVLRALEVDPAVIISRTRVDEAAAQFEITSAGTRPDLTLSITPYSFDRRRVPGVGGTSVETTTHRADVGIDLAQLLPTSGRIALGVDHILSLTQRPTGDTVSQVPSASLTFTQPIFIDGSIISTSVFEASMRTAELGITRATLTDLVTRNGNALGAAALFVQVASLQQGVSLLEETLAILRRQLDVAELDRQQGLISETSLLALQVTLNNRREVLFDTQLALVRAGQSLARILGVAAVDDVVLAREVPDVEPAVAELGEVTEGSPSVGLERVSVSQSEAAARLNDLTDRPVVAVTMRAEPTYPAGRTGGDFASSITDYFEDGAGVTTTLALNVSIPLLTGPEREARERIDRLARERAALSLEDTLQSVTNDVRALRTNRDFLRQRLELLEVDVAYEAGRVENEERLLAGGVSTRLRVDEVALDLTSRENELWQVRAELFLNGLEILAAYGSDIGAVLMELYR